MHRRQALAMIVSGALVLGGCTAKRRPTAAASDLLAFSGQTLDGARFDGRSLAGRPAVLWFWAPWCATCASEADGVATAAARYAGSVSVIGVAGLGDVAAMRQFVAEYDVGKVQHLNDTEGAVWRRFGITEQSLFALLNRDGTVLTKGFLDNEAFPARVAALAAG